MAARKLEKAIDLETGTITFGFASGATQEVKLSDFPEEMIHHLALHGLSQKATDSTAGKDPAESFDRVKDVISALQAGAWSIRGSGEGTGGTSRVTLLVEAIARIKGIEVDAAKDAVAGLSDDDKKSLQKASSVQAMILTIKQERLAKQAVSDEAGDEALALV
jgi:hypothetical protein